MQRGLIIYLAALGAFAPFSTDIYLASMPTIQYSFNTSTEAVQLTLSLFFVVLALGQLFWGPLSDRTGRKKIIFIGMILFILGSLFCAWSEQIGMLIAARVLQAMGACAGVVMAMAMAKDRFPNDNELSKVLAVVMSVMVLAPIIAPIIGSYLLVHWNWQANFYFLVVYGTILLIATFFIQESHPKANRQPLPINNLLIAYQEQIQCKPFTLAAIAVGLNFSMLFSFIASSPFVYLTIYHLPKEYFGYFFAMNASALIMGGLTLKTVKGKFSDTLIIAASLALSGLGSLFMLIALQVWGESIWSVAIPSLILTYGVGILFPESTAQALGHVLRFKGLASALVGATRFIFASGTGFLIGLLIHDSAQPLAMTMLGLNILTILCMLLYFKEKNRAISSSS